MTTIYGYMRLNDHGWTKHTTYEKALHDNEAASITTDKVVPYMRQNLQAIIGKLQAGDTVMVCRKSHLSANPVISASLIATINQQSAFVAVIDEKLIHQPGETTKEWVPKGNLPPSIRSPRLGEGGDAGGNDH
jgi:hypothetical protein